MMHRSSPSQGFTVVELIVVIVIVGLLVTIGVVSYGALQRDAADRAIQSDLKAVAGLQARYALKNNGVPKPWFSGDVDEDIDFTPTNGNVIDVVVAGDEYCIRGYNPRANKNSITNPMTEGSTKSSCLLADASSTAGGSGGTVVGWWKLNGSGVDTSGLNNHATVNANVTSANGQNGSSGGAFSFNGTSSQLVVPNSSSLNVADALTLSAWVKPDTLTGTRGIVIKDVSTGIDNSPYGLQQGNADIAMVTVSEANTTKTINTCGTTQLPVNTWTHVASTFNGSTVTLYVNGVRCSSTTTQTDIAPSTGALRIGQQKNGMNRWFSGDIDDVRVYDYAMSADTVRELYTLGAQ